MRNSGGVHGPLGETLIPDPQSTHSARMETGERMGGATGLRECVQVHLCKYVRMYVCSSVCGGIGYALVRARDMWEPCEARGRGKLDI